MPNNGAVLVKDGARLLQTALQQYLPGECGHIDMVTERGTIVAWRPFTLLYSSDAKEFLKHGIR
jgi:hypothetical protein